MTLVQRARAERCKPERGRKDTRTHAHTYTHKKEEREREREREEEDQLDKRYDFKAVSEEEL